MLLRATLGVGGSGRIGSGSRCPIVTTSRARRTFLSTRDGKPARRRLAVFCISERIRGNQARVWPSFSGPLPAAAFAAEARHPAVEQRRSRSGRRRDWGTALSVRSHHLPPHQRGQLAVAQARLPTRKSRSVHRSNGRSVISWPAPSQCRDRGGLGGAVTVVPSPHRLGQVVTAFPGSVGVSRPSLALRDGSLRRNRWYNKSLGCRNLPSARVARSRGWDRVCLFSPKVRLSPMIIVDRPALAWPRIPAGAYSAAGPSELGTSHQRYEVSS